MLQYKIIQQKNYYLLCIIQCLMIKQYYLIKWLNFKKLNMFLVCEEHQNKIQRICLHQQCQKRVLCLLCQHHHGPSFQSIMQKQSQSYKTFSAKINQAVDKYLSNKRESGQQKVKEDHKILVKNYFKSLRQNLQQFVSSMQKKCEKMLISNEQQDFQAIQKARIKNNYINIEPRILKLLLQVYEGVNFADIFTNNQKGRQDELYHCLKDLHAHFSKLMQEQQQQFKVKLPNFKIIDHKALKEIAEDNYEDNDNQQKYNAKLIKKNEDIIDSIISDCIRVKDSILVTSYDKKLRVYNNELVLQGQKQYNNILTKIYCIADNIYTIAHSKDILVQNITINNNQLTTERLLQLRGHSQKINDLHSLNTRIIGSSCSQVVKIWDLYKEKCQFTLKDTASPTCIRFIPYNNYLAVGYNNHFLKIFSIETMKLVKKYELPGLPLLIDEGKNAQGIFYTGTFKSNLLVVDIRLSKIASCYDFKKDAITCIQDSIYDEYSIATGDRSGNASIIDIRNQKMKIEWLAHDSKTNLSKPRGTVNIFQQKLDQWTTVGCNDKCLKTWQLLLEQL